MLRIVIFCSFLKKNWGQHKLLSRFSDLWRLKSGWIKKQMYYIFIIYEVHTYSNAVAKFKDFFFVGFCKNLRYYKFLLKFPDLYAISKNFWLKNYAVLDSHCDLTSFFHKVWRCYCYADQICRHYLNFHQKVRIVPDF